MEKLRQVRQAEGPRRNRGGRSFEYELVGEGKGSARQRLVIEKEDQRFVVYQYDSDWEGRTKRGPKGDVKEKCADGLLIAAFEDASLVCFIELKGKMATAEQVQRAIEQLVASAHHFAPLHRAGESSARTQGDEHHDAWSGETPEEKIEGHPSRDHAVLGVVIQNRQVGRFLPESRRIAGKAVHLCIVEVHRAEGPNVGRIGARALWERSGRPTAGGAGAATRSGAPRRDRGPRRGAPA